MTERKGMLKYLDVLDAIKNKKPDLLGLVTISRAEILFKNIIAQLQGTKRFSNMYQYDAELLDSPEFQNTLAAVTPQKIDQIGTTHSDGSKNKFDPVAETVFTPLTGIAEDASPRALPRTPTSKTGPFRPSKAVDLTQEEEVLKGALTTTTEIAKAVPNATGSESTKSAEYYDLQSRWGAAIEKYLREQSEVKSSKNNDLISCFDDAQRMLYELIQINIPESATELNEQTGDFDDNYLIKNIDKLTKLKSFNDILVWFSAKVNLRVDAAIRFDERESKTTFSEEDKKIRREALLKKILHYFFWLLRLPTFSTDESKQAVDSTQSISTQLPNDYTEFLINRRRYSPPERRINGAVLLKRTSPKNNATIGDDLAQ